MPSINRIEELKEYLLAHTTSLRQLYDQPEQEERWVVDGLIAERSLNLFVAAPKVGKSTMSRCLAYRVATGGDFLGCQCTRGLVIYVALEDRATDVKDHFRLLGATGDDDIRFIFPERAKEEICGLVPDLAKVLCPRLIIIDTLQRYIDAEDLNNYAEVTRLMTPLLDLANNAAVLCVHHSNKGLRKGVASVLGSTALSGSVANVLYMHRTDRYRTFGSEQRIGHGLDEITVVHDAETGDVTAGPSKRVANRNAVADDLVGAMAPGTQYTSRELVALASTRRGIALEAIKTLMDSGRLRRLGTGKRNDPYTYGVTSGAVVPRQRREPPNNHTPGTETNLNDTQEGGSGDSVVPVVSERRERLQGCQIVTPEVTSQAVRGDTAVSPDPSSTRPRQESDDLARF